MNILMTKSLPAAQTVAEQAVLVRTGHTKHSYLSIRAINYPDLTCHSRDGSFQVARCPSPGPEPSDQQLWPQISQESALDKYQRRGRAVLEVSI